MLVSPTAFVAAMERHWTDTLGNTPSKKLKDVWWQMAMAFGRAILHHDREAGRVWSVLQPPTGTGKSQGLAVYCALLARLARSPRPHNPDIDPRYTKPTGVLIVTRLITQADELVHTINQQAGFEAALARHSQSSPSREAMAEAQVLVITHAAYQKALDRITRGEDGNWDAFSTWRHGARLLTVIDEALDVVDHARVDLDSISVVLGVIPAEIREAFPDEVAVLEQLREMLTAIRAEGDEKPEVRRGRFVWNSLFDLPERYDMTPLRRALKAVDFDLMVLRKESRTDRNRIAERVDATLAAVQTMMERWCYYYRKGRTDTLNSAALIVPEDMAGPVVLDATASQNMLWELFEDRVHILPVPEGARSYRNVTLKVARAGSVGKTRMTAEATVRCDRLITHLIDTLPAKSRVLIVCHKDVEPYMVGYDHPFEALAVGHWGALDGRNDWSDYDTVVVFGLPYRDPIWSSNTFLAHRGPQDASWFQADDGRAYKGYKDVRRELEIRQLSVSVVQAINRVRCRRVVDGEGNCPPTTALIVLPTDDTGERLLAAIHKEMPGIRVESWDLRLERKATRRGRKSGHFDRVLAYMKSVHPGEFSATTIRETLGIPDRSWMALASRLKDRTSEECRRLAEIGISYVVTGAGRGQKAYLLKMT